MYKWFSNLPLNGKFFITAVLFLLITLPRFNGNKTFVQNTSYDAKYFISYVEYFRGEPMTDILKPATNWRMLVPFVASSLPFKPATSINLINLICLGFSLFFLYYTLRFCGVNDSDSWIWLLLFICSFPTFYYTSITYVDPGVMLFISISVFASFIRSPVLFIGSIAAGTLAKETILIVIPFYFLLNYRKSFKSTVIVLIITIAIYYFETKLIRTIAPLSSGYSNDVFWSFSTQSIQNNLHRINSYFAMPLSFGLVGMLYVYSLVKQKYQLIKNPLVLASIVCVLIAFGLYIISYCTTIADGRMIWQAYYFMIPVSANYFASKQKKIL